MAFDFTEEQIAFRDGLREFSLRELRPGAAKRDRDGEFPVEQVKKMQKMGLFGLISPCHHGGKGCGLLSYAMAVEELARQDASVAVTLLAHTLTAGHIDNYGTDLLKERFLEPLARGEKLGAWALTEPGAGSDAAAITTTAVEDKNGWMLNGNKYLITNGSRADTIVVMASTDRERGARGISAFVVPADSPGLTRGKNLEKLGFRSSDTAPLMFRNVIIPKENLLGALHHGFIQAMDILSSGRVGVAAMALGIGRACLEESIDYARKRKAFGSAIADFQAIRWMLADMATELDAASLLTHRAAGLRDQGEPFAAEASMAKLYSSEAAVRAALKAVQIHGGHGYTSAFPVERYLREAKMCEIGEGTSEIQRMIISRGLLADDGDHG